MKCGLVAVFGDSWSERERNSTYPFFHIGRSTVEGDDLIVTGVYGETDPPQHFAAVMDTIRGVSYISQRLTREDGGFAASGPEGEEEMRKISSGERKLGPLDRVSKEWEGGPNGEYCFYLHKGVEMNSSPEDIFRLWKSSCLRYKGARSFLPPSTT